MSRDYLAQVAQQLGFTLTPSPEGSVHVEPLALAWLDPRLDRYYVPVVWGKHGPLFCEGIAQINDCLLQPWDTGDDHRQVFYTLARRVLKDLPWGVYLIDLAPLDGQISYQGWLPMPTQIALVSTLAQQPDLFMAHCYASQGLPVVEVQIHRPCAVRWGHWNPHEVLIWPGTCWYPDWIGCWLLHPPVDHQGHPFADLMIRLGPLS